VRRLLGPLIFSIFLLAGAGAAAGDLSLSVSAVLVSQHTCTFRQNPAVSLDFGALDPLAAVDVTRQDQVQFRCQGGGQAGDATISVTTDAGQNGGGPTGQRMRHEENPDAFIPYALSLSPASGTVPRNTWRTLTIDATVAGAHYQAAPAGTYGDRVVVTINP
jgi:spore coat protein U-like protein